MSETYLRDVLDLPESVHAGDFKVELSAGFTPAFTAARVDEYVVTDQLREAFDDALDVVSAAVRSGSSYAAYLHGSFGSGKSHFLTVLHAVLNNHPRARAKPSLQPVVAKHDGWLRGRRFLMVPYHLVGSTDLDSALLGGYVDEIGRQHPEAPVPPVYRSDAMLDDARRIRAAQNDDAAFARMLGSAPTDLDDLDDLDEAEVGGWTTEQLDAAFAAAPGTPVRRALESALLKGPLTAYSRGTKGDADAFVPLEDGLAIVSEHAKSLGYDGVVLFLDELILWLQANMARQEFVNTQVSKLVKLIESGVAARAVPIVSFISRQRDLSKLVGEDVTGAAVKNLEAQVEYLTERFDVVSLEDTNLPAIVRERVLRPIAGQEHRLDEAFSESGPSRSGDRDVLLDPTGVTGATWEEFRQVYPLSPALLNVLVALAGALQRERTGLKLLQEMLHRRRDDLVLGELVPLGDLWDVLTEGTGAAFTERLRREADAGKQLHQRVRAHLLERYGSESHRDFVADDRLVKTLLLAALAPEVPALKRLTGARLAALNLGSVRSRTVEPGSIVVKRLRDLQGPFGELRAEGEQDPVFALHLSDLDIEPLLDAVGEVDTLGARRIWVKDRLWQALGVTEQDAFVSERPHVWKGTRRTIELVFGNVRTADDLPDQQFLPAAEGTIRLVVDYPFDEPGHYPSNDLERVDELARRYRETATIVWVPHFLTEQRSAQLGQLIKIRHLLERDRLEEYAAHLSSEDRARIAVQLQTRRDSLSSQLTATLAQAYGIASPDEGSVRTEYEGGASTPSLWPNHRPRLAGGASFDENVTLLADGLYAARYPKHPDFDTAGTRKALTLGDLRTVLRWITAAAESSDRRVEVTGKDLPLVRRVVHALGLGEVTEGPLYLHGEWRQRVDQRAAADGWTGDIPVDTMREWMADLVAPGLPRLVANLLVATYAALADRAWVHHGVPGEPPDLDRMGAGDALRPQQLPTAEEFARARVRAEKLFGVRVPEPLFARNVRALAADVGRRISELHGPATELWQSLDKHTAALGIAGGSDRHTTARTAADLLAALARHREPTALVSALANTDAGPSDETLASALVPAQSVLGALDRVSWELLDAVRALHGRDVVGDRAERLVRGVEDAARADQYVLDLVAPLDALAKDGLALVTEASRRDTPPSGPTPGPPAGPSSGPPGPGASAPAPVVPPPGTASSPARSGRREVAASALEEGLAALLADLREAAPPGPDVRYEIVWRAVDGDRR